MPSTRSLAFWVLAGIVSFTGLVWVLDVSHHRAPEMSYEGKPLEYWFNQLPRTSISGAGFNAGVGQFGRMLIRSPSGAIRRYGDWIETPEASAKAIGGIGTNALGFYLQKLTRHNGPIENSILKVAHALGYHGFLVDDVDPERGQAVTALILLKPLPPGVVSELVALSTKRNRQIAAAAHCVLTTKKDDLVLLHSPYNNHSIDADLLKILIPPDFLMMRDVSESSR
jgi:hypothetical protein